MQIIVPFPENWILFLGIFEYLHVFVFTSCAFCWVSSIRRVLDLLAFNNHGLAATVLGILLVLSAIKIEGRVHTADVFLSCWWFPNDQHSGDLIGCGVFPP